MRRPTSTPDAPRPPPTSSAAAVAAADEDVRVACILFIAGCFLLPWLWAANLLYFRREVAALLCGGGGCCARKRQGGTPLVRPALALWLRRSLTGLVITTTAFVAWVVAFQTTFVSTSWGQSLLVFTQNPLWWQDDASALSS